MGPGGAAGIAGKANNEPDDSEDAEWVTIIYTGAIEKYAKKHNIHQHCVSWHVQFEEDFHAMENRRRIDSQGTENPLRLPTEKYPHERIIEELEAKKQRDEWFEDIFEHEPPTKYPNDLYDQVVGECEEFDGRGDGREAGEACKKFKDNTARYEEIMEIPEDQRTDTLNNELAGLERYFKRKLNEVFRNDKINRSFLSPREMKCELPPPE